MIPDGELSSAAYIAGFNFPVKSALEADKAQDWEMGGVALNDPSQGLELKLWHFTLEVDADTLVCSVFVKAPGTAKILLFTGMDITEIAGAFDQNMNPFVAYTQGSNTKIYWFDPTIPDMTHTTLPAGCYNLRCTLDDKRQFNVGASDILLSYIRAGNLCIRYQRERYLDEHILKAGAGPDAELVSLAMNEMWRVQWHLRNYALPDDPQAVYQLNPYLADIVMSLCRRAGVNPNCVNVGELYTTIVEGFKCNTTDGVNKRIDALREMFIFDKSEKNKKLYFPRRGRPVVARIPYKDLIADEPSALKVTLVQESELAKSVTINHLDPAGGYAKNKQTAFRRSNLIKAKKERKIESEVVMTADQAMTSAVVKLRIEYHEQQKFKFATSLKYTQVVNASVVEVEDKKGVWYRIRVMLRNDNHPTIEFEGVADAGPEVYASLGVGNSLRPPVSTTPGLSGDTRLEILNTPVQRDQDDELGLYIAAAGEGSGWSGYTLYYSIDGGTTYVEAFTSTVPATLGETTAFIDFDDTVVEVLVNFPLESVTSSQLDSGANRAVIGDEEIQFETATLIEMVGSKYKFELSGLRRGRLRTLYDEWPVNTRFVLLDESVVFAQLQRSQYGATLTYKAVSLGQSGDEVVPLEYDFDFAFSQTEWAVGDVLVAANEAGEGAIVTWTPAPRLGTFGPSPFESKYFLGYRLKFSDGFIVDVPPGTVSYIYEDAYLAGSEVTVEVWSLNAITGECAWAGGQGAGSGGGGGEEPGGGSGDPPVTVGPNGAPASTSLGANGGYADNAPYPIPQPTTLGSNVISNGDFSAPGVADWKKQNGSALDSRWSNTSGKLRFEGSGSGDHSAYNYGAFYSVPIWPFARYTFTVSGKLHSISSGAKIALGVARGFSTSGGGVPTYSVDTITEFEEYPIETLVSKSYTHSIDVEGKTLAGQYVIGTFMPVLVIRLATGEMHVATLDDASMIISEYMPAMTEIFLDNIDFPADDETGWTRYPYVSGMSAELTFNSGFVSFVPTNAYAVHSYIVNNDKLNNHVSWAAGHRIRIKWKSWNNDPTAYGYITTNGSAACVALSVSGAGVPTGGVPGWQSTLFRGDYTEYEFWMKLPGDSATFDAYVAFLMKTIVGKETRLGDFRIWITNNPEP